MSGFLNSRYDGFEAYVPGEQPQDKKYIKLNTNESPYPPSPLVAERVKLAAGALNLYSDPESAALRKKAAELLGLWPECILPVNGSDEALNFAFMAFCGKDAPVAYPEISYGFYSVLARLHGIPAEEIPVKADFSIDCRDFAGLGKTIAIANPNAPTGLTLSLDELRTIVESNPGNVVLIDEAYIRFGGESAVPLVKEYPNLLVVHTFSKSHSLAGARLGFAIGSPALIADLNMIKYSTNPYNVNRMTSAAGVAAMEDEYYYEANCRRVAATRDALKERLRGAGYDLTDSRANFLFVRCPGVSGAELYAGLRQRGVLVRHFGNPRITDYLRVSIGTPQDMDAFFAAAEEVRNGR